MDKNYYPNNNYSNNNTSFLFLKRIKLVRQVAECHADDGDDDVGDGRPPLEDLDEKFQTEVVDENIAYCYKQISDNLRSATQGGTWKTDMSRHPETCQEGDWEFEHKGCNVGREGDKTEVKDLTFENEMVEHIVQHPFQSQIQAATSCITE